MDKTYIQMNEGRILMVYRRTDNGTETIGKAFVMDHEAHPVYDCFTLEKPWKDNQRQVSCIPAGEYDCQKVPATTNIPYPHIAILNVPGRDGCCIHTANYYFQLHGCIAVGKSVDDLNKDGQQDVLSSRVAFSELMDQLPDKFKLTIK